MLGTKAPCSSLMHVARRAYHVTKPPSATTDSDAKAKLMAVKLPPAFRPTFVDGKWHKPEFSRRKIAWLRKQTLLAGEEWPYDSPPKPKPLVVLKGHKFDQKRLDRYNKIEQNMKDMPAKIEEYYKNMRARRPRNNTWLDLLGLSTRPSQRS